MSRNERKWEPGCIQHVMNRGIRKSDIFHKDEDYQYFLMLMRKIMQKYDCKILAYCQMTNHFHILLETGKDEVGKPMCFLQSRYAEYYNHEYSTCGHLFQSRFVSSFCQTEPYLIGSSRYIHLNPVKAGIVSKAEDYKYSSYRDYIAPAELISPNNRSPIGIACRGKILSYFDGPHPEENYRKFVEAGGSTMETDELIRKAIMENEQWMP